MLFGQKKNMCFGDKMQSICSHVYGIESFNGVSMCAHC